MWDRVQSEYTPVSYNTYLLSHIMSMQHALSVVYQTCLMCIVRDILYKFSYQVSRVLRDI